MFSFVRSPLPPLGHDVDQPGTFDVLLPVRVNYDTLRDKIMQAVVTTKAGTIVKEMQIYPSSGKLVIGVPVAKPSDTDPAAGGSSTATSSGKETAWDLNPCRI